MRIPTALSVIILVLSAYAACLAEFSRPQNMEVQNTLIVKKEQSGEELRVRPGDVVRVELSARGSAGYAWYIDTLNPDYVELMSEETKKIPEQGKIGAAVTTIWCFRARKEGASEIRLDYYRKWEGKVKSADHFFIKLHITNSER